MSRCAVAVISTTYFLFATAQLPEELPGWPRSSVSHVGFPFGQQRGQVRQSQLACESVRGQENHIRPAIRCDHHRPSRSASLRSYVERLLREVGERAKVFRYAEVHRLEIVDWHQVWMPQDT